MKKKVGDEKIQGIGGWLLLPTLGLVLSVLFFYYYSSLFLLTIIELRSISLYYAWMVIFIPLTFLFIYVLVLEFKKKKKFKSWAIAALWVPLIIFSSYSLNAWFNTNPYLENLKGFILNYGSLAISSIIWTIYFLKSKRVKNTFVN